MKPTCRRQRCQRSSRPVERKLGPSGWLISSRPQVVAVGAAAAVSVRPGLLGQGQRAVVVDAHDLHRVQVDDRQQAADRPRVGVGIVGRGAKPGDRPGQPPLGALEVADRPRLDVHQLELVVADAAAGERRPVAGIGLDRLAALHELVDRHRRLALGDRGAGDDLARVQRDDGHLGLAGGVVEQGEGRLPGRGGAALAPGQQRRLLRLVQADLDEAHPLAQPEHVAGDRDRARSSSFVSSGSSGCAIWPAYRLPL